MSWAIQRGGEGGGGGERRGKSLVIHQHLKKLQSHDRFISDMGCRWLHGWVGVGSKNLFIKTLCAADGKKQLSLSFHYQLMDLK